MIIKNVPVGVCGKCRERYYEAATLEQQMRLPRKASLLRKECLSGRDICPFIMISRAFGSIGWPMLRLEGGM